MLGRSGRSASFTSNYGVQVVAPSDATAAAAAAAAAKKAAVLELPSLNSFSDDFGIRAEANKEKQRRLTAVVYPTQIVIPKNKKRKDSTFGEALSPSAAVTGGLKSSDSLASPSLAGSASSAGGAPSPSIKVNGEDGFEQEEQQQESK